MKYLLLIFIFLFISIYSSFAQKERTLAIIDFSGLEDEGFDKRFFSVAHACQALGVPFDTINEINQLSDYKVAVFPGRVYNNTLTQEEVDYMYTYVHEGGTLIFTRVDNTLLCDLCGISENIQSSSSHYKLHLKTDEFPQLFKDINQPEETTISLGKEGSDSNSFAKQYELSSGIALGVFEDSTVAFVRNTWGKGQVYLFGTSFKFTIFTPQINKDNSSQRTYSNGFEPSADVIMMLLRNIYTSIVQFPVLKHTSTYNSKATVMVTHDIDSRTGYDSLYMFAQYEAENDIKAHYFVTTRYFKDDIQTNYYTGYNERLSDILDNGHSLGSHSVGHFSDFSDEEVFPKGSSGNTKYNYSPYFTADSGTINGTVYGELEVSKQILEDQFPENKIVTFRAGHLCHNPYLVETLQENGYLFNSTNSANDVLTNFPYQTHTLRSSSGALSHVYEIPMTISDVWNDLDEVIDSVVNVWEDVILKNAENNAPTVLLIHPNRTYKLAALKELVDRLPEGVQFESLEDFGYFWRDREELSFESSYNDISNVLSIQFKDDLWLKNDKISLRVPDGKLLDSIKVFDSNGLLLEVENTLIENSGDVILSRPKPQRIISNYILLDPDNDINYKIYGNEIQIISLPGHGDYRIEMRDVLGRKLAEKRLLNSSQSVDLNTDFLNSRYTGVGILVFWKDSQILATEKVFIK